MSGRGDCMKPEILNGVIRFSGTLNEDSDFVLIRRFLEELNSTNIAISFRNVQRANSCGIIAWFKLARELDLRVRYLETPVWLIEQFNMSPFFLRNATVESFYAPFYEIESGGHEFKLLRVGIEVPILSNYSDFEFDLQAAEFANIEADFQPEEYFFFISANFASFKQGAA
jgi:hypothetical protein